MFSPVHKIKKKTNLPVLKRIINKGVILLSNYTPPAHRIEQHAKALNYE